MHLKIKNEVMKMGKGIKYFIVVVAVILSVIAVGYPLISIVLLLDLILFVSYKKRVKIELSA